MKQPTIIQTRLNQKNIAFLDAQFSFYPRKLETQAILKKLHELDEID
jgi:hypothetical protein